MGQMARNRQEELFFKNPEIKIIVLHRRNVLSSWLSMVYAKRDRSFSPGKGYDFDNAMRVLANNDTGCGQKCKTHQLKYYQGWAETGWDCYNWLNKMLVKHNRQALFLDYETLNDPQSTSMEMYSVFQYLGLNSGPEVMQRYSEDNLTETLGGKGAQTPT